MAQWLELDPPDQKVSGSSPAAVMLFPGKRVSVFSVDFNANVYTCIHNKYLVRQTKIYILRFVKTIKLVIFY